MQHLDKPRLKDPKAFGYYLREQGLMLRRTRQDVKRELPPLTKIPHRIDADMAALDEVAKDVASLAKLILQQGGNQFEKMKAGGELDWRLR